MALLIRTSHAVPILIICQVTLGLSPLCQLPRQHFVYLELERFSIFSISSIFINRSKAWATLQ